MKADVIYNLVCADTEDTFWSSLGSPITETVVSYTTRDLNDMIHAAICDPLYESMIIEAVFAIRSTIYEPRKN